MKKILTIMTAAAVLLCGLVFTGCGVKEIVKETVDGSYKTWYKYKSNRQIDVPLLDASTTEEETTTTETTTEMTTTTVQTTNKAVSDLGLVTRVENKTATEAETDLELWDPAGDITEKAPDGTSVSLVTRVSVR